MDIIHTRLSSPRRLALPRRLAIVGVAGMVFVLAGCATPTPTDSRGAQAADAELMRLAATPSGPCNAKFDPAQTQYIVGYGSLMQDESRKRTAPNAGTAYPVAVKGFRRGWFAKGGTLGFDTTYLGVVPDAASQINAVFYQVDGPELAATDQREAIYCRLGIEAAQVTVLKADLPAPKGQIWIYTNKADSIATATPAFPLVQSYVDIFVSGCLEQEQRYQVAGFAQQCLKTTTDWSGHWVNDRLYPRRPFIYQPRARAIDKLLAEQLPEYFRQIRIE